MNRQIQEVRCRSASEFVRAILPTARRFVARASDNLWIFRGQRDSSWGLVPSAFRANVHLYDLVTDIPFPAWTNEVQVSSEIYAITRFVNVVDRAGLQVPEDSQALRSTLQVLQLRRHGDKEHAIQWPPESVWSVLALAQHYGVPTRLLDWSWNSTVAAYFAAVEAAQEDNPSGDIVVWAYHTLDVHANAIQWHVGGERPHLHLVRAPYAQIPNLKAQRGLHMLLDRPLKWDDPADRSDFASVLIGNRNKGLPRLLKFTVSASEAVEVLRLLSKLNVSAAAIYPGFDGAVKAIQEFYLWARRSK